MLLNRFHYLLMAPAGDADGGGAAVADRGDDFVATEDGDNLDDLKTPPPADEPKADAKAGEGDETDEGDEGDEKKGKKDEPRIPLSRHKAILERDRQEREALQRQLAQYQNGQKIADTNQQIDAIETKLVEREAAYAKALTDGEPEKAAQIMREIRSMERQVNEIRTEQRVQVAQSEAIERARFDIVVERLQQAYPQLDENADEYDEQLVGEVLELQRGYVLQNYTPAQALQKAVKVLLRPETAKQEQATNVTPRVEAGKVAAERRTEAVKKTADAAARTPAALKVGMDSNKAGGSLTAKDVMKLSQEEFAKLDEDVLARMRGDLV